MSDYVTKTNLLSALGRFKGNTDDLYETKADANDLKNAVDDLEDVTLSEDTFSKKESCSYTLNTGFKFVNGTVDSSGGYAYYRYTTNIPVNEGDVVSFTTVGSGKVRVITAYSNGSAVSSAGVNSETTSPYTVPTGIDAVSLTFYNGSISAVYRTYSVTVKSVKGNHGASGLVYKFNLSSDNFVAEENLQDINRYIMQFRCDVGTFNGIIIAHGYNEYMGGYVKVTPTTFEYYLGTEASPRISESHGLTIKDYLAVRLVVEFATVTILIATNGGTYTKADQTWDVRNGVLSARSVGSNTLTNCVLAYDCTGWKKDIHIYGDSYLGIYTDKWSYYLTGRSDGRNDFNLNGYPGRGSAKAMISLRLTINNSYPKKIIWCLGMNDGDSGAVNTTWKNTVEKLMTICENRGIELILATIPNVPTVDNTYKNQYVRESGYRYIDFANAVGASSGTTWYDDMLSNDGVHPTIQGAIALYNQAIADVPELMNN